MVFFIVNVVVDIDIWVFNNFDLLYYDIFDGGLLDICLVNVIVLFVFII